jgi:hypothetical protein
VYFIIFQASALSIKETYGHLNLLINVSGIFSIPGVLQPGKDLFHSLVMAIIEYPPPIVIYEKVQVRSLNL